MPTGKNASYRYRLIDQALRNTGRAWKFEDLLNHLCDKLEEEFDVNIKGNKSRALSPRQLMEDIHIMRKDPPQGYSAPIIRKEGYVYYEDSSFSINDNPLNETDIDTLNEVVRLIKSFQSLPHLRELETIIGKVQGSISRNFADQIIELEHIPNAKGLHHIEKLYHIIREERVLLIRYQPFSWEKETEYLIHPFIIKEYNNRWFLLGWCPDSKKPLTLGLDRIIEFKVVDGEINKSKKEDLINRQKNIIGVSLPEGRIEEVRLLINNEQYPYILTKPIHSSQIFLNDENEGHLLTLNVIPNFELEQTILMFGERVKVLSPKTLVEKIKSRIDQAKKLYKIEH